MTSITDSARADPAWSALTGLARIERGRRAAESGGRLGHADRRLLWLLSDDRPRTLRTIADELGLEQSTVNRQVNAALKAGLLTRSRPEGHAAWLFEATSEALAGFADELEHHLRLLNQALDTLPATDRTRFLDEFSRFATAYADVAEAAH